MAGDHTIVSSEIREIGRALFGLAWQGEMAKAIGVPRQSAGYYLKAGGVKGAQAAAIIGPVARIAARELVAASEQQANLDTRQAELLELLRRFDSH